MKLGESQASQHHLGELALGLLANLSMEKNGIRQKGSAGAYSTSSRLILCVFTVPGVPRAWIHKKKHAIVPDRLLFPATVMKNQDVLMPCGNHAILARLVVMPGRTMFVNLGKQQLTKQTGARCTVDQTLAAPVTTTSSMGIKSFKHF
jgi:hypothetical protein